MRKRRMRREGERWTMRCWRIVRMWWGCWSSIGRRSPLWCGLDLLNSVLFVREIEPIWRNLAFLSVTLDLFQTSIKSCGGGEGAYEARGRRSSSVRDGTWEDLTGFSVVQ